MPSSTPSSMALQIETLFDGGSVAGLTDCQLIDRFTARRDAASEIAFAALVSRHGPMVLDICLQWLADPHDAEDAFQAVFLVLARKARSIGDPGLLANWLYGVAIRVARNARTQRDRRRKKEETAIMRRPRSDAGVLLDHSVAAPEQTFLAREQAEILHTEIDGLPVPFRTAVVLCYFEGLTLDQAARRLHCPAGTVRSRLARAYDKLRRRLNRRGVALSTAAIASALASHSASAGVSAMLCETTARAAMTFMASQAAAGAISSPAAALANEMLRSMLVTKLRLVALALLLLGPVAAGAGFVAQAKALQAGKPDVRSSDATADSADGKPAPGRMFVVGRVLDPQGNPVPNASVMVYARSVSSGQDFPGDLLFSKEFGRATTDSRGRIHVDVPRISSADHDEFGMVALAPGFGASWVQLFADDEQPAAEIKLFPERVIHGRMFDLKGVPARNVKLSVSAIRRILPPEPGGRRERHEGPAFWWGHADDMPGWPSPAISDADGQFTVHGVGPGFRAFLTVIDSRFTDQVIEVDTDANSSEHPLNVALEPAHLLTGLVIYADAGKPAANARIEVLGLARLNRGAGAHLVATTTDATGRFSARVGAGPTGMVTAFAPNGEAYRSTYARINWPKGALSYSQDLALPRGQLLRGKVTEQASGQPVVAAAVSLVYNRPEDNTDLIRESGPVPTGPDGSFELAVAPLPGYLIVRAGSSADYVLQALDHEMLARGKRGGRRLYAHAFVPFEPSPATNGSGRRDSHVAISLRRGETVRGLVVAPDRQPIPTVWMISRIHLDPRAPTFPGWSADHHAIARNGRFLLHGLDPDTEIPVTFLEPVRKLGLTTRIAGRSASTKPICVKLAPCAMAVARLVARDGRPVAGFASPPLIKMVVTPGEFAYPEALKAGRLFADEGNLTAIDPVNYLKPPASDSQGRIIFPALVPGATYRIIDPTTTRWPEDARLRKEFTVKPGEALDLGDILIEKTEGVR